MKLRREDKIVVLSGRDKGKTGTIQRVLPKTDQVVVEGVNLVKRHTKPSKQIPRGGILEIIKPLSASKVAFVCPNCNKPTRLGYQINGEHKDRICRKCKTVVK